MFEKIIVPITLAIVAVFVVGNIVGFFAYNRFSFSPFDSRDLGESTSKRFDLDAFEDISIFTASNVTLVESGSNYIEVDGPERIIDQLRVKTDGDELVISEGSRNFPFFIFGGWGGRNLDITINTTQKIQDIDLAGSVELRGADVLDTDGSVRISGSGEVELAEINNQSLDVTITGSGDVELEGVTEELEISISGSGSAQAYDLISQNADVSITGSGEIQVYAEQDLKARISGSGEIEYKGDPKVDQNITGSGEIEPAN